MDCQVKFTTENDVVELALRFTELPRAGEHIVVRDGSEVYSGAVLSLEHHFNDDGPHTVKVLVQRD